MKKILVFDSHPVQYRVPLWKALSEKNLLLHVVYASDCSVKGYNDVQFGKKIAWDGDMMSGYEYTVLNCENGTPLRGWKSLTGKGVKSVLKEQKPDYVFLTGFNYKYDMVAYFTALFYQIPILLRCETQDYVTNRSRLKYFLRYCYYSLVYKGIHKIFFIGELNKEHYLKHGVKPTKLYPARYTTENRFLHLTPNEKEAIRNKKRETYGFEANKFVIGFSGKFIPKKNPDLLLEAVTFLPDDIKKQIDFLFIGSGELEESLKLQAKKLHENYGTKSYFTGFVNQSELLENYLVVDILVLPSRKQGETWGLVANEGLQAGCSVIVSDSVGSHKDFENLQRFRVCKTENAESLAMQIKELVNFDYNPEWAIETVKEYSIENNASSIESALLNA